MEFDDPGPSNWNRVYIDETQVISQCKEILLMVCAICEQQLTSDVICCLGCKEMFCVSCMPQTSKSCNSCKRRRGFLKAGLMNKNVTMEEEHDKMKEEAKQLEEMEDDVKFKGQETIAKLKVKKANLESMMRVIKRGTEGDSQKLKELERESQELSSQDTVVKLVHALDKGSGFPAIDINPRNMDITLDVSLKAEKYYKPHYQRYSTKLEGLKKAVKDNEENLDWLRSIVSKLANSTEDEKENKELNELLSDLPKPRLDEIERDEDEGVATPEQRSFLETVKNNYLNNSMNSSLLGKRRRL